MGRPIRHRRVDPKFEGRAKAEPRVVTGVADQGDKRLLQRIGRAEHGVHECGARPLALRCRAHGQRAEAERRAVVHPAAGAHHVSLDVSVGRFRHQGQRRQPLQAHAQRVDEPDLHGRFPGRGLILEGRAEHGPDGRVVRGPLATYQHG